MSTTTSSQKIYKRSTSKDEYFEKIQIKRRKEGDLFPGFKFISFSVTFFNSPLQKKLNNQLK